MLQCPRCEYVGPMINLGQGADVASSSQSVTDGWARNFPVPPLQREFSPWQDMSTGPTQTFPTRGVFADQWRKLAAIRGQPPEVRKAVIDELLRSYRQPPRTIVPVRPRY